MQDTARAYKFPTGERAIHESTRHRQDGNANTQVKGRANANSHRWKKRLMRKVVAVGGNPCKGLVSHTYTHLSFRDGKVITQETYTHLSFRDGKVIMHAGSWSSGDAQYPRISAKMSPSALAGCTHVFTQPTDASWSAVHSSPMLHCG
jgi:hypothetical protein